MRSPSHRFRRIFRAKSEAKAKSENRPWCRAKSESRPRWKNPDLGAAQARQAGGSDAGQAPGGYARQECGALGVGRARTHWASGQAIERGWASQYSLGEPVLIGRASTHWANPCWASHQTRLGRAIKRGWASQYSLGEPVLIGRTRVGRAIKQGWGEPSNEVGRASTHWASPYSLGEPVLGEPSNKVGASHQTRLGEPVLIGRVRTPWAWANPYWANHSTTFTVANACPCLALCLLGTVPARHVRCLPTSARSARLLTSARSARLLTSARLALCLLGAFN